MANDANVSAECYPFYRTCYEVVEKLNQEKGLGLSKIDILVAAGQVFADTLARMNAQPKVPGGVLGMVNWDSILGDPK